MGTDILTKLRAAGITLSIDGGNLVATPKAAITDELRSLIRTHKTDIMEALAHPDPLPPVPRGLGGYGTPPGVPPLGDCELARQIRSLPEDDHVPGVAEDLNDTAAGPGCTVTAVLPLFKPRAPVNLEEVLAAACDAAAGITTAQFLALLSLEDLQDIGAGDIPVETLRGYAESFAEGMRSGRLGVPGGEHHVTAIKDQWP